MDNKNKGTIRDDSSVISSGVKPLDKTQKDVQPVISSGIVVAPQSPTKVISAGVVSASGTELILNGKKYNVLKIIARSTGEAEVYLVECENKKYVLKYYYPQFKPKDSVLRQLKGLSHEDIVDLVDYGYYQDRFFEILEYAEGGSLMDVNPDGTYRYIPIKDIRRLKEIIAEITNAFEFCHSRGIIHRDIKPENIFFKNPDGTDVLIGDFGISSTLDEGLSKHMTGQARTEIYAAPELYQSIGGKTVISKEVDYYSLGITILHIWSGEEPFKDQSPYGIMRIKCEGKVYLPEDMPDDLKNLVKGLITVEPSKRWGYNEVQRWLRGDYVPVYYKSFDIKYNDFHFGYIDGEEVIVNDPAELSKLLEKYPQQGKKHLYKGTIAKWLENVNQSLYVEIRAIVEDDYPTDQDAGLTKAIYVLDPLKNYKTFSGVECRSAEEIGDAIERESSYYRSICQKQHVNADLFIYFEARGSKDIADSFRKFIKAYNPERAFNMMVLKLQGDDHIKIGNTRFTTPDALLLADDKTKDEIIKMLKNPDSKLSIWLEQFPSLRDNIDKWRRFGRHNKITLTYALEAKRPFHFFTDLAFTIDDFKQLFEKYLLNKEYRNEMTTPGTVFVDEADFWLKKYNDTKYIDVVDEYIKNKVPNLDQDIFSDLLGYTIKKNKFDLNYYWDTLKPMIDNGILKIREDTASIANYILEKYKDNLREDYSAKRQELLNNIDNIQKEIEEIDNLITYSFYDVFKEAKKKYNIAESKWDENIRSRAEESCKLVNEALIDIKNIVIPEISRIKAEQQAKKEEERIEQLRLAERKKAAIKYALSDIYIIEWIGQTIKIVFYSSIGGAIVLGFNSCEWQSIKGGIFWGAIIGIIISVIYGLGTIVEKYNKYLNNF